MSSFYEGALETGSRACELLLARTDLPPSIRLQARRNQVFYASPLRSLVPSAEIRPLTIPVTPGWSRFNPTIAAADDGFRMIVRSSNFVYDRGSFILPAGEGVIRTTNYLVDLDDAIVVRRVAAIEDRTDQAGVFPSPVAGYEDCRLVRSGGGWAAIATTRDRNPGGVFQVALLRLDDDGFHGLRLLSDAGSGRDEKNWVPLPAADDLRFVSAWNPTVLLRYDDPTSTVTEVARRAAPIVATDFRGGSGLVPLPAGFLAVVHETIPFADGRRLYAHRFVVVDGDYAIGRVSPQFVFRERAVEFCCGLAERNGTLLATFGHEDREAYLATMRLDEVLAMTRPTEVEAPMTAGGNARAVSPAIGGTPAAAPATVAASPPPSPTGTTPFPLPPRSAQSPELLSVTLTGGDRDLIGDALRSVVDWVDACLLVDTGATDDTMEVARAAAGPKLIVRSFPWQDDFAAARNAALGFAAETGAAWAVILDTDERLRVGALDVRAALAATGHDILLVPHAGGAYAKDRFFRLPARGRFVGPTHEAFIRDAVSVGELAGARFDEVPKSPDGYRRKFARDAAILARHTAEHPDDPRWFYYLGDALQGLGRHEEAIAAYNACAARRGWDEEAAWACYRAAECRLALGQPDEAIASCAAGMAHHAGLAELPWLAGFAAWQAGRVAQAVYWSRLSIALGHAHGAGQAVPRLGFRTPRALHEGPYDVLRFALRALGDEAGAAEAERLFAEAEAAREARLRTP